MKKVIVFIIAAISFSLVGCNQLPTAMRGAKGANVPPSTPKHVALLLPLSGPVASQAKAVENGFFTAFYKDKEQTGNVPQITVLNTTGANIDDLYQQAINKGADLVVGPLLKENVEALEKRNSLPVPVLALNSINMTNQRANNSLFEFGLSPNTEAKEVANKISQSGYHNALVITPSGKWGNGIANAFDQRFKANGGKIVDTLEVSPSTDLTLAVKKLLKYTGIPEKDKNKVASDVLPDEAPATIRRTDFDVIFLATLPTQARQIKPLLNFYYAANIPVYATSLVYSGKPSAHNDKDLNGIIFCDMPWAVAGTKNDINTHKLARLFAFGEDAFSLTNTLPMLSSGNSISGRTGELYMDSSLQIRRELSWAQFKDGVPVPVA